jgi:hypothetical protein
MSADEDMCSQSSLFTVERPNQGLSVAERVVDRMMFVLGLAKTLPFVRTVKVVYESCIEISDRSPGVLVVDLKLLLGRILRRHSEGRVGRDGGPGARAPGRNQGTAQCPCPRRSNDGLGSLCAQARRCHPLSTPSCVARRTSRPTRKSDERGDGPAPACSDFSLASPSDLDMPSIASPR